MRKVEEEAKATRAVREEALKEAKAAVECCEEAEARLNALQGEQAELRFRKALRSLCRDEFDAPMATPEDGFPMLTKGLVAALELAVTQMDKILDSECRDLFFAAPTRLFSHLHLCDPGFDLSSMIVPALPRPATALQRR
ncbi:hypothetical protein D1007_44270 [Hordeum vulgare]|nr:hypothetical protein D1007_44270 [Hordeum vulgare]